MFSKSNRAISVGASASALRQWYIKHLHKKLIFLMSAMLISSGSGFVSASLEEIVVTARKKAEGLQDTPISITALSGERLEDMGLTRVTRLQEITPNLVFQNTPTFSGAGNNAAVYIRGIGQRDFIPTIDPGVGIYVDEVYLGRSAGAVFDMIDIGQVEVLRGPQGTLFGRNTIGGAISISTKKPDDIVAGKFDIKLGTDGRQNVRGMLNLPISESLYMRVSATMMEQDGYVFRPFDGKDLGNQDYTSARVAFRWEASETFTADLSLEQYDDFTNGPPMVITRVDGFPTNFNAVAASENNPPGNFPYANNIFAGFGAVEAFTPDYGHPGCSAADAPATCYTTANAVTGDNTNLGTGPNFSDMANEAITLVLSWDLEDITAKLIAGSRSLDGVFASDRDGYHQADGELWFPPIPLEINPVTHYYDTFVQDQTSIELQLSGTYMDDQVDWILGAYSFKEDGENINPVDFTPASLQSGGYFDYSSSAIFAQATVNITDALSVTTGIRHTKEDRDYTPDQYFEELPLSPPPPMFRCFTELGVKKDCEIGDRVVPFETVNNKMSETTPLFNLAYTSQDGNMIYFTYSEGFKVGGFNQRIFPPEPSLPTFAPEFATSYEFGTKAELLDNSLRINSAIFVSDYSDLQLLIAEPSRVGPYVTNTGEATIKGFELEVSYVTTSSIFLDLSIGFTDAGYDNLSQEALYAGLSVDSPFGFISEWNTHLSVTKSFDLGGGTVTPRIDWAYRSGWYTNASGVALRQAWLDAPELYQPGYSVVNINARWESSSSGLSVIGGIDNLADEQYKIFGDYQPNFGSDAEAYDRGRQWFLIVGYEF